MARSVQFNGFILFRWTADVSSAQMSMGCSSSSMHHVQDALPRTVTIGYEAPHYVFSLLILLMSFEVR